ncbi:MAG TPA: guanylate kinase [Thermoanaerobaculia bacterium]|nr:guanylate kinase [Thermoanaerobaculia bacterium]
MKSAADLFIVSSPSGAGKTTLIRRVLADPTVRRGSLHFSVSHTTRPPRPGEKDGREYHFVTDEAFRGLQAKDGFLEWASVHGNLYGTSRMEVEPRLASGTDVLLDIDVQGARQVRSKVPEAVKIFVFPPSRDVLEARLRARASDAAEVVARRLAVAAAEMSEFGEYDYAIINDDLEEAVDELRSIVVARRAGRSRRRDRLEAILKTFAT